jgi:hypothetical protein
MEKPFPLLGVVQVEIALNAPIRCHLLQDVVAWTDILKIHCPRIFAVRSQYIEDF